MANLGVGVRSLAVTTNRAPSGAIWGQCPWLDIFQGTKNGWVFHEDFIGFGETVVTASNIGVYSAAATYHTYEDTGGKVHILATETDGVLRLETDTTDNDEVWLCTGGNKAAGTVPGGGGLWKFPTALGGGQWMCFEARIRYGSITIGNWAVGLTEEAFGANDAFADAGTLIVKDYIGFEQVEAVATAVNCVHATASGAQVVVQAAAETLATASTWLKVGMLYHPDFGLYYYTDGQRPAAAVVAPTATNFPDGEELQLSIGIKNSSAAANTLDIDWWRMAAWYD